MIKSLYINNYKTFVNFSVSFDNISVMLGKNGSGKSNLLLLIASLCTFIRGQSNTLSVFSQSTLTRWLNSDIQTFDLCLSDDGELYDYHLEIKHYEKANGCKVYRESVTKNGELIVSSLDGTAELFADDSNEKKEMLVDSFQSCVFMIRESREYVSLSVFQKLIDKIVFCVPNPKLMRDIVENDIFFPLPDFSNIASAYSGITQLNPEIISVLWDKLRNTDVSFVKSKIDVDPFGKYLSLEYRYDDKEYPFRFSELSDGERMLFSLYLLMLGYINKGMTVLLDEPDNYLALNEIQPWCMEIEEVCEERGQCIFISHHPEVIDYFAEERGMWFSRLSSGESVVMDDPFYKKEGEKYITYSELMARGDYYEG